MAGTTFQNKKWTKMRDSEVMSLSEQLNLSGKNQSVDLPRNETIHISQATSTNLKYPPWNVEIGSIMVS